MNGFTPIYNKESRILILGSFPSVISRENNFYYGNPRNKFWKIMQELFEVVLISREDKINFLIKNNIALWDIVSSCEIVGSLDVNLKSVKYVNLMDVLPPNTQVNKILCNGKKSFELTTKYLKNNNMKIDVVYLPSTSPANFKFDVKEWRDAIFN